MSFLESLKRTVNQFELFQKVLPQEGDTLSFIGKVEKKKKNWQS